MYRYAINPVDMNMQSFVNENTTIKEAERRRCRIVEKLLKGIDDRENWILFEHIVNVVGILHKIYIAVPIAEFMSYMTDGKNDGKYITRLLESNGIEFDDSGRILVSSLREIIKEETRYIPYDCIELKCPKCGSISREYSYRQGDGKPEHLWKCGEYECGFEFQAFIVVKYDQ